MKKLSNQLIDDRDALQLRAQETEAALEKAVDAFNEAVQKAWEAVESAMTNHNEMIDDANSWREACAAEISDYIADRSEKWQSSEKAQPYAEWLSQFEYEEFHHIEWSEPEPLDINDVDLIEEQLATFQEELES